MEREIFNFSFQPTEEVIVGGEYFEKIFSAHNKLHSANKGMTHGDYKRGGRHGDRGLRIGRHGLKPIYNFINESDSLNQPFFVWYAPFLPHTPHNPPKKLKEKYLKIAPSPFVANYWATVEWFDQTVGKLLNYLKEKGLEENTIIVFTSDNGWIQSANRNGYAPKSKRAPHEGGIRTPIMFKYSKIIQPQLNTENVLSNVDIVPTVLSLLGLKKRRLPGINVLDENHLNKRKVVFSEAYEHDIKNIAVPSESILYKIAIEKKWKLLLPNKVILKKNTTTIKEKIKGYYSNDVQLFDLTKDTFEINNVAEKYPQEVKRLTNAINEWWKPKN